MEERRLLNEFVHWPDAINVLQGIANSVYQQKEILRLEAQLRSEVAGTPFYIISRALILADSKGLIETDKIRDEPLKPLIDKDVVYIGELYAGHVNSEIMNNHRWTLDEVYRCRRRVLKVLEISNEYQIVLWEARRRKREKQRSEHV